MNYLHSRGKILLFLTCIFTIGFITSLYYFICNNLSIINKLPFSFYILIVLIVSYSHILGHLIEYHEITNYMNNKIK